MPEHEVLERLGQGGMGVVYKARHTVLGRFVALKMIRAPESAGEQERARFRTEAQAVARLQHPNIVQIHEVGEQDGQPFFSLEYVDGGSLAHVLAGAPMAAAAAAALVETLARAVEVAHRHGIVHRDLKPANVLMTADGVPKITDFGLAKRLDEDSGQTHHGAVLGTPSYMAPEQAAGQTERIGPAADVYALGAILYETLTGRPPFRGATVLDTLEQVRKREPFAPSNLQAHVPRDLDNIVLKCLEKDHVKRYGSAFELAADLQRFREGRPVLARPLSGGARLLRWCRRNRSAAAALTLLLIATLAVVALAVGSVFALRLQGEQARTAEALGIAETERQRATEERQRAERLSAQLVFEQGIGLCRQGEAAHGLLWLAKSLEMAQVHAPALDPAIRLELAIWSAMSHPLQMMLDPGSAEFHDAVFRPDGRMLATSTTDGMVRFYDIESGNLVGTPLHLGGSPFGLEFDADGTTLLAACFGDRPAAGCWRVADGKVEGNLWQPPGRVLAINNGVLGPRCITRESDKRLGLWDAATHEKLADLTPGPSWYTVRFSADGRKLFTLHVNSMVQLWDATTGMAIGAPIHAGAGGFPEFSRNGAALITRAGGSLAGAKGQGQPWGECRLWSTANGAPMGDVFKHPASVNATALSADGNWLCTGCVDRRLRLWDVVNHSLVHTSPEQDSSIVAVDFLGPRLIVSRSADGEVCFWERDLQKRLGGSLRQPDQALHKVRYRQDGRGLVLLEKKTVAIRRFVAHPPEERSWPRERGLRVVALSDDGSSAVTRDEQGRLQIHDSVSGDAKSALILGPQESYRVALSPDGTRLATAGVDLRIWDAATGEPRMPPLRLRDKAHCIAFSPDGRTIMTGDGALRAGGNRPSFDYGACNRWSADDGRPLGAPLEHHAQMNVIAASPDGRMLLTGGSKHGRLWDAVRGVELRLLPGSSRGVNSAAFSPDGRKLLTGGRDGDARLWDVASGEQLLPTLQHPLYVNRVGFSPDERLIATSSQDVIRFWDAHTGRLVGEPRLSPDRTAWAIDRAGYRLVTATDQGLLHVVPLPKAIKGDVAAVVAWVHSITGLRLTDEGAVERMDADAWQQCRQLAGSVIAPWDDFTKR